MTDRKKLEKYLIIGVIALFVVISATYAFFQAQLDDEAQTDVNVGSNTTDSLTFDVNNAINLNINQFNFGVGAGNLARNATASATLLANNSSNTATYTYYVYFKINSNEFIYTTSDSKPEIILTVTDPTGQPVTSIDGLTYVPNIQTTTSDGSTQTVSGFDITTASGTFAVASAYSITANSTTPTTQNWEFTATFINLDSDQQGNTGKEMDAEIIIQQDELKPTFAEYIMSLYTEDGVNDLYYHDGQGTYGTQEAGDNSYRYTGANPNNYVCFGSDEATCSNDNLYRIIGVFGNQVKLIKHDYARSNLLRTNGAYNGTAIPSNYSTYKGSQSTLYWYYWNNSTNVNTWSESNLNTVNLNQNYLNNIGSKWSNLIANTIWYVGGGDLTQIAYGANSTAKNAYNYEQGSNRDGTTYSAKIGLMYLNEYYYAASPSYWTYPGYTSGDYPNSGGQYGSSYDYRAATSNNWMCMGWYDWTISRRSDGTNYVFVVYGEGNAYYSVVDYTFGVRPSFYLESSVVLSGGSGTSADPYRIA